MLEELEKKIIGIVMLHQMKESFGDASAQANTGCIRCMTLYFDASIIFCFMWHRVTVTSKGNLMTLGYRLTKFTSH